MKCPNCNSEVKDGMIFCSKCGTEIPQINFCSQCGAELKEGINFCPSCGYSIVKTNVDNAKAGSKTEKSSKKQKKYKFTKKKILIPIIFIMLAGLAGLTYNIYEKYKTEKYLKSCMTEKYLIEYVQEIYETVFWDVFNENNKVPSFDLISRVDTLYLHPEVLRNIQQIPLQEKEKQDFFLKINKWTGLYNPTLGRHGYVEEYKDIKVDTVYQADNVMDYRAKVTLHCINKYHKGGTNHVNIKLTIQPYYDANNDRYSLKVTNIFNYNVTKSHVISQYFSEYSCRGVDKQWININGEIKFYNIKNY